MYSQDKIILIQINYFSIGCNSFFGWLDSNLCYTNSETGTEHVYLSGKMGATVLFLLPQEIITKAITGTDLERKDLSANGNQ